VKCRREQMHLCGTTVIERLLLFFFLFFFFFLSSNLNLTRPYRRFEKASRRGVVGSHSCLCRRCIALLGGAVPGSSGKTSGLQ
jgi:hypothetical protein